MTVGGRASYDVFDNLTAEEFRTLLGMAKLSDEDKDIAVRCIVHREAYIDTGAVVHMDRRTVARRMDRIILPELVRMLARMAEIQPGA